jgi:hypothetical protein
VLASHEKASTSRTRPDKNGVGSAKAHGDVRASSSGHHAKAWWSRDRGRKVHRILRRALIDGRHPRSSRTIFFHEKVVTVVLAALSHSKRRLGEGQAHREWKRERRQGCQRLDRSRAPWEENAHARATRQANTCPARGLNTTRHVIKSCVLEDPPKRSERRENARFPGQACRSPDFGRRPRGESRGSVAGNMRGAGTRSFVRVAEVDRTHRASCPLVRSQGLMAKETRQGASQKEARSTA